ncbi:hypothetical protein LTR96_011952, partial [Exophiala xenobiotica]
MLKDYQNIFLTTPTVFERFLEQSRTFSITVLMPDSEHSAGHWMHTARRSFATETQQTRRGNGNLNIDQNRILDNKAEEECLRLRFKQGLHLAKKSQPADHRLNRFSRYTLANEAEEEHLCRKFNREKTYFPEK